MPFGRVVSIGRGSFTFRMSFETGARFSRSTLLVGIDLSAAGAPWVHPVVATVAAKSAAAAARIENPIVMSRLIVSSSRAARKLLYAFAIEFVFAFIERGRPAVVPSDSSKRRFARLRPNIGEPRAEYRWA